MHWFFLVLCLYCAVMLHGRNKDNIIEMERESATLAMISKGV